MGDDGPIGRMIQRGAEARWRRAARRADTAEPEALRRAKAPARRLRDTLDRFLGAAERRIAFAEAGTPRVDAPGTDWVWRPKAWGGPLPVPGRVAPEPGTRIAEGLALFHESHLSEIVTRQTCTGSAGPGAAPCALTIEVFGFDGGYLSLALDLPGAAAQGLQRRHILRAEIDLGLERPLEVFARLNIRHGPNTEKIVREVPVQEGAAVVEFDLAYSRLNEKRVERLWLDLIFERPEMNRIALGDLVLSRRPRAEL